MKKNIFLIIGLIVTIFILTSCENPKLGINIYEENGKQYIVYGKYPQSLVTDKELIEKLSNITEENSQGYIEYNNVEYKKIKATPHVTTKCFKNEEPIVSGETYFFKVEPIKWRVLETLEGSYKVISEVLLDVIDFYTPLENEQYRKIDDKLIMASYYEYSNIRAWLNGYNGEEYNVKNYINIGFLDLAFSKQEESQLREMEFNYKIYGKEDNVTNDKVAIPSTDDMINTKYGFINEFKAPDLMRVIEPTDYSICRGAAILKRANGFSATYWLNSFTRSSGTYAYLVSNDGMIPFARTQYEYVGVRPLIQIEF